MGHFGTTGHRVRGAVGFHQSIQSQVPEIVFFAVSFKDKLVSGLQIEMTQEELADILGMSRVQITRELTALRAEGILATKRGRLLITDLPKLAALCSAETV